MRDMTKTELDAWNGLLNGDLEPLALLLAEEQADMHPIIQRNLLRLILGSANETDFRLVVQRHPDLKPKQSRRERHNAWAQQFHVANAMLRNGADRGGQFESAVVATMRETGLSRASVTNHWKKRKSFIRFCIAHGVMKRPQ